MINFENVSKSFHNGVVALNYVNFQLQKGELAFITGHSGAGKTTLLKLIMALEYPTTGAVTVNNYPIQKLKQRHIPSLRRSMGMVLQNPYLLSDRTVFDNVALPLEIEGMRPIDITRRVRAALEKVGLTHKEYDYPNDLSSGEQQRVGIARAVVNRPSILIADEPTGNLDPGLSAEIMHLFEQFSQVGVTVLIASHDQALITHLHHRVLTLSQGTLIHDTGVYHHA